LQNIIEKVQDAARDVSNAIQDKMPAGTQPGGVGRKPGDEWTQLSSTGELNPAKKEAAEKNNPDGLDVMVCDYLKSYCNTRLISSSGLLVNLLLPDAVIVYLKQPEG
jgi:hypothetical protein